MQAPIFVVTLKGDDERRRPLLESLSDLGLDYELFYGVDGRSGLPEEFSPLVDQEAARRSIGREITDGELACALSHRAVYIEVMERGLDGAIVLEDDAKPAGSFARFVMTRPFEISDLTLLYHSRTRVWRWGRKERNGCRFYRLALPCCGAVGYAVSRRGAELLLRAATPVSNVADWPLDITAMGAVVAHPCLVGHDPPSASESHLARERDARASARRAAGESLSDWVARHLKNRYWRRRFRRQFSMRIR